MTWSPTQYTQFEDERTRPVRDLVAAIPTTRVRHAIDLGCGPANSTEILAARYPGATISGLDSDPAMIQAAQSRLPKLRFHHEPIETWSPAQSFDVILSNAALHWVPDHDSLLPRLVSHLAPGGTLAIQMPDNLEEPAHALMRSVAARPEFAPKLAQAAGARTQMATPSDYFALLRPHAPRIDIWRTTYHHLLPGGPAAVVEWFKGSGLRPFLAPLPDEERTAYLARYQSEIANAYPPMPGGAVLLPFPRLFLMATAA